MRNVERHRRDALAMERLTSTPNIVDIYGHCANTILTEYAPRGLPEILKHSNSKQQKLDYALQTAKGVASLHAQQIVHADLQSKQFLVQTNGVIKLNDFNRCRFLPIPDDHHNRTTNAPPNNHNNTEICPIRIPSAPGVFRSPEEYDQQPLTEKLDIYSLGNVLFEILADGARPFHNEGSGRIKEKVRHGQLPEIPPEILRDNQALATLVHLCLTHDPNHRIAAQDLVQELTILLEEQQG